jgi:hypothetical protein
MPVQILDLTIHDPATDDYYEIRFTRPDQLTAKISFPHALGDLALELFDETQTSIAVSDGSLNEEEIVWDVLPGTYFVRVYTNNTANHYRMDLFASAGGGGLQPDKYEYNDDLPSCEPIILNFADTELSIHTQVDEDYFCFDIGNTRRIIVELLFLHVLGDIDVTLWCIQGGSGPNACDGRIVGSSSSTTDNEIICGDPCTGVTLGGGQYYIQVQAAGGDTNTYEMYVTAQ